MSDLSSAIQEFLNGRPARGIKPNTIRNERGVLRAFLASTGNILVRNIDGRHIDMYLAANPQLAPGTINRNRGYLQGFFAWCRSRKYMSQNTDPFEGLRKMPVAARDFIFIPKERFGEALDAAKNGRDRAAIAIGLYSFQRASEMTWLTWDRLHDNSDNPREWSIEVFRTKTQTWTRLPLSLELKHELDRWRLEYGRMVGEVPRPEWKILPAFKRGRYTNDKATGKLVRVGEPELNPPRMMSKAEQVVQFALTEMGYPVVEREGAHTLRRSGGKALYRELVGSRGYDGAMDLLQYMFGHKSRATTEHYLRITLDEKEAFDALAGATMFSTRTAEVVEIAQKASSGS